MLRSQRVMLEADVAALNGVEIRRLNQRVRRNTERSPEDLMFALSQQEWVALRSQFATLDTARGQHRR